jgi:hypothetical protein
VSEEPQSTLDSASASVQSSLQSASGAVQNSSQQVSARVDERPEIAVGAAFGGGLLFALILKRLAR